MKIRLLKIKIRKINIWDIWVFLTVCILVIPDGIGHIIPAIEKLFYKWGLYAVYAGILFMFAIKIHSYKHLTKNFHCLITFSGITIFILFLKGHNFSAWYSAFSPCLFIALFAEANRHSLNKVISSFLIVLEFWIYVNFILMLMFPNGMYYLENNNSYLNWVLGYKSSLQYYVLPALCFSWINLKYTDQKLRYILLLSVCWASTIISSNSMLLVGLFFFTVFQFSRLWNVGKLFNIWTYYGVDLAANVVIVFFLTWFTNTALGFRLLSYLGKTATISRRASIIWPMTLEYIKNNAVFGNGFYTTQARTVMYGGILGFIHSHNQLMEILFIGGVLMSAFYVNLHIQIGESLSKNKTPVSKILSVSIFVLYLMMSVEVFTRIVAAPIWFILYIAGNCELVHNAYLKN